MKSNTLVAVAYTGDHFKVREGHIPAIPHQEMLLEAIRNVNPDNEFEVLVSANAFSIMDIADDAQRYHVWQVCNLATILSMRVNHGHQMGQAWAIRQALEYAKVRGCRNMFWTAEDILYDDPFVVRNNIAEMEANNAMYVGRYWGNEHELNCQVFGCNVEEMLKNFWPQDFALRGGIIEAFLYERLLNVNKLIKPIPHHHEHSPEKFLGLLPHVREQQRLIRQNAS